MDNSPTRTSAHDAVSLESVVEAWRILRPALWPTRLLRCPALDEISGYRVWLKPENLQHTGSYKIRGAYYKLHRLKEQKGTRKVIAASAGNHAQGVAYAARELGMDCVIVMPERAPLPKRRAMLRYGAQVALVTGGNIDTLTLQRVLERSIAATGREMTIAVRIKGEPGELGHVLDFLRRSWKSRALISDLADIEILIETEDERHGREVLEELAQEAKARNFELLREPEQQDSAGQ